MGGQIIDAMIVSAPPMTIPLGCAKRNLWSSPPNQRNTDGEKADIRGGRIPAGWADKPAKLAQKDRDARWTVKFSKAKPSDDSSPRKDLAVLPSAVKTTSASTGVTVSSAPGRRPMRRVTTERSCPT